MHTELSDHNVLVVNPQAILQTALELEGRDVLQSLLLFHCLDQLADIYRKLSVVGYSGQSNVCLALPMDEATWQTFLCDQSPSVGAKVLQKGAFHACSKKGCGYSREVETEAAPA